LKTFYYPGFKNQFNRIIDTLRPFEVVELEKFVKEIMKKPLKGERKSNSDYFKRGIITYYFSSILIYEYSEEKDELVFWDIR